MFIRRMQSLIFSRSLLTTLLAEVHLFCWKEISGFLIEILSIVFNLNEATHILGLQLNS